MNREQEPSFERADIPSDPFDVPKPAPTPENQPEEPKSYGEVKIKGAVFAVTSSTGEVIETDTIEVTSEDMMRRIMGGEFFFS